MRCFYHTISLARYGTDEQQMNTPSSKESFLRSYTISLTKSI